LPGFVKQKQLYALYRRSTVLLFPSIGSEGCPLVGLEAMYFGNTAIGYDTGGAGEWLVDGQTGIRVERGDIDGLAQAMARLAADPQERFRLRRQAREYVRAKFRCEQHIRDVIHLYHQAIQDRQALV
ncbi:MAG TPA: glycosyltransferase family 4 protein, partial [Tichowtungia sp.]|nr:glycosyltransferase family 4 protein [Tichowtungia sp.]